MTEESLALLREIGDLAEQYVKKKGISQAKVDEEINRRLKNLLDPTAI